MSLYIDLFHGRKDPNENPEDWGLEGPVLGPFDAVQITYMGRVQPVSYTHLRAHET